MTGAVRLAAESTVCFSRCVAWLYAKSSPGKIAGSSRGLCLARVAEPTPSAESEICTSPSRSCITPCASLDGHWGSGKKCPVPSAATGIQPML